jgi:hypothetical protein
LRRAGWPAVGYLLALLFIVRPAMVAVSTAGSKLTWRERALLAWIAPRGIVAAAVASVFALRLADTGGAGADLLVPVTFMVIIGTVAVYGLTAAPLARRLGVAQEDPQGFLILGANQLARALGKEIQSHGLPVRLIDTNWSQVTAARMEGLPATYGSILSEKVQEEIDLAGIGRMLALTPNDEINALAAIHYAEIFGRHRVFQIMPRKGDSSPRTAVSRELTGRRVFGPGTTYAELNRRLNAGAELKNTQLTEDFTYRDFAERYGESAVPLIVISGEKKLRLFTEDDPPKLKSGNRLVSLVKEKPEPPPRDEAKKD